MTTLTYIFHSCFVAETGDAMVVFDYWKDNERQEARQLLARANKPVYAVVSHFHPDHYNPVVLQWAQQGKARLLLSYDVAKRRRADTAMPAAILRPGHTYEDEHIRLRAFRSTDIGVSVGITLGDGTTLFHCGDLNNWRFDDPEEDAARLKVTQRQMEGMYLAAVREVAAAYPAIDHLMFPLDPRLGRNATRGARQWLERMPVRHFHPMHFWNLYPQMRESLSELQKDFPATLFHLPADSPLNHSGAMEFITSL